MVGREISGQIQSGVSATFTGYRERNGRAETDAQRKTELFTKTDAVFAESKRGLPVPEYLRTRARCSRKHHFYRIFTCSYLLVLDLVFVRCAGNSFRSRVPEACDVIWAESFNNVCGKRQYIVM